MDINSKEIKRARAIFKEKQQEVVNAVAIVGFISDNHRMYISDNTACHASMANVVNSFKNRSFPIMGETPDIEVYYDEPEYPDDYDDYDEDDEEEEL